MKTALASNHEKLSESGIKVQNKEKFSEGTSMIFTKSVSIYFYYLECFKKWEGNFKAGTCLITMNLGKHS